ncbi:MAG TPA: HlyD family efflux transporter periplasmic adaptor subunit [Chitinophagaceae bacterium]|jgi:HlyD family secretion protein|nr:HlyD family efflux transporter periplasmic adaptor subunit [Chitinophagaceae bacterium]
MKFQFTSLVVAAITLAACSGNGNGHDASGTFEADEVIVSSSANGKILSFNVEEGSLLTKDSVVGIVDPTNLSLQKQQVEATIQSLGEQTVNVEPQVKLLEQQLAVQQSQLDNLLHEKTRLENLIKQDAATGKQLDDMNSQIDVLKKQMSVTQQQINVQKNNVSTQNRGILSQGKPLEKQAAQLEDLLMKTNIRNPITGTVLAKYAEAGEITSMGKAMYKIADLSYLNLRAYITGTQLPKVKLGQQVKVFIDDGKKNYKQYDGTITWISDKAEFTPKTIQTKEERANLVYAIKVKVKNDGYLKIGMYGEVGF